MLHLRYLSFWALYIVWYRR